MKKLFLIPILSLLFSAQAFGTGASPRIDKIESGVGVTYVGVNPEVGGSSPFQMTIAHKRHQVLNPAGAITVKLPSVGISAGDTWKITNRSTNKVTIQDSSAFYLNEITFGTIELVALANTPTGTGTWVVTRANSQWLSYTPSIAGITGSATMTGMWKRIDDTMFAQISMSKDATAASGSTTTVFGLPVGPSMDTSKQATQNMQSFSMFYISGTGLKWNTLELLSSASPMTFRVMRTPDTSAYHTSGSMEASVQVRTSLSAPITEWKMNP